MKRSNVGTVNAVSPCCGLYTMPLRINSCRTKPTDVTLTPSIAAISPERCGPGPSSAMARMYSCSRGVNQSSRTRKMTRRSDVRFGHPDLHVSNLDLEHARECMQSPARAHCDKTVGPFCSLARRRLISRKIRRPHGGSQERSTVSAWFQGGRDSRGRFLVRLSDLSSTFSKTLGRVPPRGSLVRRGIFFRIPPGRNTIGYSSPLDDTEYISEHRTPSLPIPWGTKEWASPFPIPTIPHSRLPIPKGGARWGGRN